MPERGERREYNRRRVGSTNLGGWWVWRRCRKLCARNFSDQLPKSFIIAQRRQIWIVLEQRFVFVPQRHRTLQPLERLIAIAFQRIDRRHRIRDVRIDRSRSLNRFV